MVVEEKHCADIDQSADDVRLNFTVKLFADAGCKRAAWGWIEGLFRKILRPRWGRAESGPCSLTPTSKLFPYPNLILDQLKNPAMVKTYSKYELSQTFGLVTSALSNVLSIPVSSARNAGPGAAVVGANEEVLTWDIKKGELLSRWKDDNSNSQVTAIARSQADRDIFAAG